MKVTSRRLWYTREGKQIQDALPDASNKISILQAKRKVLKIYNRQNQTRLGPTPVLLGCTEISATQNSKRDRYYPSQNMVPHNNQTCRRVSLMDKHRLDRCHKACLGCALRSIASASMITLRTSSFGCPTLLFVYTGVTTIRREICIQHARNDGSACQTWEASDNTCGRRGIKPKITSTG